MPPVDADVDVTKPGYGDYIRGLLARHDDPVLLEMEAEARESGFPAVGRMVGVVLEILARSIGAKRVFELGSGFGYSGYWFARGIGDDGELHLTDGDPENERKATDYLGRAGLGKIVSFHVGDAIESLASVDGDFDIVFCDINKDQYPAAWAAARDRIRPGGMYICDNTLRWGAATVIEEREGDEGARIAAVRSHNEAIANDPEFLVTILPIREGVLVARREISP
jgi:caffeoyl-CoA O-methyltransferase